MRSTAGKRIPSRLWVAEKAGSLNQRGHCLLIMQPTGSLPYLPEAMDLDAFAAIKDVNVGAASSPKQA